MAITISGPNFMVLIIFLVIGVGIANICLLLGLIHAYWRTYKELKSQFTSGLLLFASFLLLQNILTTAALIFLLIAHITVRIQLSLPKTGELLLSWILLLSSINIIQFIALIILFRITRK